MNEPDFAKYAYEDNDYETVIQIGKAQDAFVAGIVWEQERNKIITMRLNMEKENKTIVVEVFRESEKPDLSGDIHPKGSTSFQNGALPLIKNFSHRIEDRLGKVVIRNKGDSFIGEMMFYKPETFELVKHGYPAIYGTCTRDGNKIIKAEIQGVSICANRNVNEDIKSLNDQLKEQVKD